MAEKGNLEDAVARALKHVKNNLPEGVAAELAAKLRSLPLGQMRFYLANSRRAGRAQVVLNLLRDCAEVVQEGPEAARTAAEAALAAAEGLPAPRGLQALKQDLMAEALAWVANAHRLAEDYEAAEATWGLVQEAALEGSGDPLLLAQLSERKASLHIDKRRFGDGERALQGAIRFYRTLNEPERCGRVLMKLGHLFYMAGEPARALPLDEEARAIFVDLGDTLHGLLCLDNIVQRLEALGHTLHAFGLAEATAPVFQAHFPEMAYLRSRWTRGRLSGAIGALRAARSELEAVHRAFLEKDLAFDASLVALDLALVHAKNNNWDAQRHLAEEMLPVFQRLELHQEAMAALLLYASAARNYGVSKQMAADLLRRFEPLRRLGPKEAPLPRG